MDANDVKEKLGPAERIIQTVLAYSDHMVHNRPGMTTPDPKSVTGVSWQFVTHKTEDDGKVVYVIGRDAKKKTTKTRVGVMQPDGRIMNGAVQVGTYRPAGIFPEVAEWLYRQVAEIWKIDNEFAARWASYAFTQEHKDLKVVLAAFMLCQSRKGDPVTENGKIAFHDEDFRDVGEAMALLYGKELKSLDAKLLLRIHALLKEPKVVAINRELGFAKSARAPFFGRWDKVVDKWLRYREQNPKMLEGLVRAGFRTTIMDLAGLSRYKPSSPKFFEIMRWKQMQGDNGQREVAIGAAVTAAASWEGLTEAQICEKIMRDKPGFKQIEPLLPKKIGLTRAIMAASIEAGALSDKDLIIRTPTLEELGLFQVQEIRERWEKAQKNANDMRAANIALRVKSQVVKEKLQDAADNALKAAVEEQMKGLRVYFIVDISGSMDGAIEKAKQYIAKFLPAFPPEKLHVSVFNAVGREVSIKHPSTAGVENAFRGISASGGTHYGQGVKALAKYKPTADEDALMIFVGDEECSHAHFASAVRESGINPTAFGLVRVMGTLSNGRGRAVQTTAAELGIPCFMIDEQTFSDAYAIPRTIHNLIAATPVGAPKVGAVLKPRETLIDTILKTELLKKPAWAA